MSPIEDKLWSAIIERNSRRRGCVELDEPYTFGGILELYECMIACGRISKSIVACHVPWDTYQIDILLVCGQGGLPPICIAIECDGHGFHEKTKEQAARDKSRDRQFMLHGMRVMRFTGSEIWHRTSELVDQIYQLADYELRQQVEVGFAFIKDVKKLPRKGRAVRSRQPLTDGAPS